MTRTWHLLKQVWLLGLFAAGACAQPTGSSLERDLAANKVIVVIVNADEDRESEQYADWSHYLNEFASSVGDRFVFHKVRTNRGSLRDCPPEYREPYSAIFMRRGDSSFVYSGPIVEPQVYEYVRRYYQKEPIPGEVRAFAPDEVRGQALKVTGEEQDGIEVLDCEK